MSVAPFIFYTYFLAAINIRSAVNSQNFNFLESCSKGNDLYRTSASLPSDQSRGYHPQVQSANYSLTHDSKMKNLLVIDLITTNS